MNIYTDGKQRKEDVFGNRKDRDKKVKELRADGWEVKVGKYSDVAGCGEVFWYEAKKEKK